MIDNQSRYCVETGGCFFVGRGITIFFSAMMSLTALLIKNDEFKMNKSINIFNN